METQYVATARLTARCRTPRPRQRAVLLTLWVLVCPPAVMAQQTAGYPVVPAAGTPVVAQPQGGVMVPTNWVAAPAIAPVSYGQPMMSAAPMTPGLPQQTMMVPNGYPVQGADFPGAMVVPATVEQTQAVALPVQNSPESARMVSRVIQGMPSSQEDLELIERRSQLVLLKERMTRFVIADPSIIDVVQYSDKELGLMGVARGSTTLTMWFENHPDPLIYLIKVIRDPNLDQQRKVDFGRLERQINTLFPNSKVYIIPMSWRVIVRGQARDQEEANHILQIIRGEVMTSFFGNGNQFGQNAGGYAGADVGGFGGGIGGIGGFGYGGLGFGLGQNNNAFIINELRVPGEFQVQLRVRIAQLNRSQARNMGINLDVAFNNARHAIVSTMGGVPSSIGGIFENGQVGVALSWLAANGTAKILTEPNVVVLSGRPARFLAGGEFAVPTTVGINGAAGVTTSFRGFGTSLFVTPTVVDRDLIRIQAIAEYSDLNAGIAVGGVPGTNARRVETAVEMREGQTLALAGLLSHQSVVIQQRIPFLGDIPKVGPLLFSNKRATQEETELLILISPEIVRPMDAHEVPPVPGFEVTHPMDEEFYKHNMTEGMPDTGYYQVPPYGSGANGTNVGYQHFNPGPAGSMYSPTPTNPSGSGFSTPTPIGSPIPSGSPNAVPPAAIPPSEYNDQRGNGRGIPPILGTQRTAPGQPSGIQQTNYAAPRAPQNARPSQTISPTNYSGANRGANGRVSRDTRQSTRY
jgi:pilus assembly protein CpaC